jgi:hypothetical protein
VKNNMAFNLIYTNLAGPLGDINVSAGLVAEAGQVGVIVDNAVTGDPEVQLASSGTTGMLGIIDDNKTATFTATAVNETVVSGQSALVHANLVQADGEDLSTDQGTITIASAVNGTIVPAVLDPFTPANVSYGYIIAGKAGDDTTLASGKCTIWLAEGEYSTDVFELASTVLLSSYTVGTDLYVADNTNGQEGRLTSNNTLGGPSVATVTKAPTAGNPVMNFFKTGF